MKNKFLKAKRIRRSVSSLAQLPLWMSVYFYTSLALAADTDDNLGKVASTITGSFGQLAKLITAGAYMAGIGFCMASMLKFKAHKDNPTQIPIGTPIALLFIGAALIFLPNIFRIAGYTIFGGTSGAGGVSGTTGLSGSL
ncbi:type IV secretion protein IcmD [Candidatus Rickettsiella isopodorum]|uniref:Type IV secretion protein IcmD n=2 Tax=Coxiellaceae TaxID=118968 RepID=A0A1J8NM22_9COXI|nr:type IV secretion protein IcmD [Candidatus Rickettsiella isopodorum]